jgi:hypothetical protein
MWANQHPSRHDELSGYFGSMREFTAGRVQVKTAATLTKWIFTAVDIHPNRILN